MNQFILMKHFSFKMLLQWCKLFLPGVVVWLRSELAFEYISWPAFGGIAILDMIRVWCHVTVFLSDFDSHGIDHRRIFSASIMLGSHLTSPAAASDHRRCEFNGNNGKFNGLREQRWNGAFIASKWPGGGSGPRIFSRKLCTGLGPRTSYFNNTFIGFH